MTRLANNNYLSRSLNAGVKTIDCCTSSNYDEEIGKLIITNIFKTKKFLTIISKYPEKIYEQIIVKLIKIFGKNHYFFGNGSEDLIVRINTFAKLKKLKVAVVRPLFYRIPASLDSYQTIEHANLFKTDFNAIDVCWLVNPNSVNDKYVSKDKLLKLIRKNSQVVFVIDETSIFYFNNWQNLTLFSKVAQLPNLIVISSLSKYFGIPGIRFGFGATSSYYYKELKKISATYPISSIVASCVNSILSNFQLFDQFRLKIEKNKKSIADALRKNSDIEVKVSKLNFVICRNKKTNLCKYLAKNDLLTFCMNEVDSRYHDWVRITVHSSDIANRKVLKKLSRL